MFHSFLTHLVSLRLEFRWLTNPASNGTSVRCQPNAPWWTLSWRQRAWRSVASSSFRHLFKGGILWYLMFFWIDVFNSYIPKSFKLAFKFLDRLPVPLQHQLESPKYSDICIDLPMRRSRSWHWWWTVKSHSWRKKSRCQTATDGTLGQERPCKSCEDPIT